MLDTVLWENELKKTDIEIANKIFCEMEYAIKKTMHKKSDFKEHVVKEHIDTRVKCVQRPSFKDRNQIPRN